MVFNFPPPPDGLISCGKSGKLEYFISRMIGTGSMGTLVYEGKYEKHPVAIKMMPREIFKGIIDEVIEKVDVNEARILREYSHTNVIRYYILDLDERFIYLTLELCKGSLADYLELHQPDKIPDGDIGRTVKKHLLQGVLEGLDYLHDENIVHGDLKPQNILLQANGSNQAGRMKYKAVISDFGLSLKIDPGRRSKTAIDNKIGTDGWRPKEVILALEKFEDAKRKSEDIGNSKDLVDELDQMYLESEKVKGTKFVDIFAFGCIIQYVMHEKTIMPAWTMHPFCENGYRNVNIKNDDRKAFLSFIWRKDKKLDDVLADMLIGLCVGGVPELRPNTKEIHKHPFFWEASERYQFIERVANDLESLSYTDSLILSFTEKWKKYHSHSFGNEIKAAVEHAKHYYESNSQGLAYNFNQCFYLNSLLRIIRNTKQHYERIRRQYGDEYELVRELGEGTYDDFDRYFLQKIIHTLPVVYALYYTTSQNRLCSYKGYYTSYKENPVLIDHRCKSSWKTLDKIFVYQDDKTKDEDPSRKRRRSKTPS